MIYGLQADIQANPNRNIQLYVPGKTQLTATDVFLGGPGTGVTDRDLNGATRVYGDTVQGTSKALDEYTSDLASQIRSAVANNAAPRADAYRGMPTMQRQQMEINQANSQIQNAQNDAQITGMYNGKPTLQQKQFNHSVDQDNFNNGINLGQLTGTYGDQPTLSAKAQALQNAQFYANLSQDNSQFNQKLAADMYNSSNKAPTQSQQTDQITGQAMDYLNKWASGQARDDNGNLLPRATADQIQAWVKAHSGELEAQGADITKIAKYATDNFDWNP